MIQRRQTFRCFNRTDFALRRFLAKRTGYNTGKRKVCSIRLSAFSSRNDMIYVKFLFLLELRALGARFFVQIAEVGHACLLELVNTVPPVGKLSTLCRHLAGEELPGATHADIIDYLLRDSYHAGVDYGRFDWRR